MLSSIPAQAQEIHYTVVPGDNAWNLTERYLRDVRDWPRLQQHNRLVDDRRLMPGTVLRIPAEWLRLASTELLVLGCVGVVEEQVGDRWTPVVMGRRLVTGSRLRTGDGGSVTLGLADGSRLTVRPGSELQVVNLGKTLLTGATMLYIELLQGGIESDVHGLQDRQGQFQIQTPAATTSVRGTVFRISAQADITRTEVLDGRVALANSSANVLLPAATGSRAQTGQAPEAARPLLDAPQLGQLPSRWLAGQAQALALPPLAGAQGYRSQLMSDSSDGSAAVLVAEASGPQPSLPAAPAGRYQLRLRGIDAVGLEGHAAIARVSLEAPAAAEPPPAALAPPVLNWQPTGAASGLLTGKSSAAEAGPATRRFQWQLRRQPLQAAAAGPGQAAETLRLLDEWQTQPRLALTALPAGRYSARLREVHSDGPNNFVSSDWSSELSWVIEPTSAWSLSAWSPSAWLTNTWRLVWPWHREAAR